MFANRQSQQKLSTSENMICSAPVHNRSTHINLPHISMGGYFPVQLISLWNNRTIDMFLQRSNVSAVGLAHNVSKKYCLSPTPSFLNCWYGPVLPVQKSISNPYHHIKCDDFFGNTIIAASAFQKEKKITHKSKFKISITPPKSKGFIFIKLPILLYILRRHFLQVGSTSCCLYHFPTPRSGLPLSKSRCQLQT